MKKKLLLLHLLVATFFANAQNIGIGTTTPQATLDVKGNQRIGGVNKFMTYDSVSGKIQWVSSNLYIPVSQYLFQHSAAQDGLYYNNNAPVSGQLEYRNASGSPVFYTNFINGNGYFSGNLGIGAAAPAFPLSFGTALGDKISLWSNSSNSYGFGIQSSLLQIHTDISAADIAFGYGSSSAFTESMRIKGDGNVGIGISSPLTKLHVSSGASGATPFSFSPLVVEGNGHTYINLLSPAANETAILFGQPGSSANGIIMYNNISTPNGFQFRNNGNITRMVIDNTGNIGIGTISPLQKLHVEGTTFINGNLGIGNSNPAYQLDISNRMRIRSGGNSSASAGLWLNNNANTEAAFIGMEDDTHVGFYGNGGAGWKFGMNTQTGALKINGTEGSAGQLLQSNGAGAAPTWITASGKTKYYRAAIPPVILTNGSPGLEVVVPVNVEVNSIITLSITATVSTANFVGCSVADFSISMEPAGGGGILDVAGRYKLTCGLTNHTIATGENPLALFNQTMQVFGPGANGVRVTFFKSSGPDITIGNSRPATIVVKVVPL